MEDVRKCRVLASRLLGIKLGEDLGYGRRITGGELHERRVEHGLYLVWGVVAGRRLAQAVRMGLETHPTFEMYTDKSRSG